MPFMYRYEPSVGIKTAKVEVALYEQPAPDGEIPPGWYATRAEATEYAIRKMKELSEALLLHAYQLRVGSTRGEGT